MLVKWNQWMETTNWLFYALMRVLIPGGVVLHFFGIPYGSAQVAFTVLAVLFAYRRRKALAPVEIMCWLIAIAMVGLLQVEMQTGWQWLVLVVYGLWILNQQQLQAYLIPGAFGKSFGISLGLILLAITATSLVGLQETIDFLRWSLPIFLLSAMLMMVRINLIMAYRQRHSHQINREKNLLFFNGVSVVFFIVGGFFLFSAWLPPDWTAAMMAGLGQVIQWILYPLAVVLAKGSQVLKQLILLLNPERASQESISGGLPEGHADLASREAVIPFVEWAGWIVLVGLVVMALVVTLRRKKEGLQVQEAFSRIEEKSFMSLDEIFQRKKKTLSEKAGNQKVALSNFRKLFADWLTALKKRGAAIEPAMTPNQIGEEAVRLDSPAEATRAMIETYNRVRYRGDQPTESEEKQLENLVRSLEENQNFQ